MKNEIEARGPLSTPAPRFSFGTTLATRFATLTLGTLLIAAVGSGCGKTETASSPTSGGSGSGSAAAPSGPVVAPLSSAPIAAPGTEAAVGSPADVAWKAIQAAYANPPMPPDAWQTNEPDAAAIEAFKLKRADAAAKIAEQMSDFYTKYGSDERAATARLNERQMLDAAIRMGRTNLEERLTKLEDSRLATTNLPTEERFAIKAAAAERAAQRVANASNAKAGRDALLESVKKLNLEFPEQPVPYRLIYSLSLSKPKNELRPTLEWLVASTNAPEQIQEFAKATLAQYEFLDKPLDLKFTAVDGQEIDLAKLKGKVVLLDFWATWCQPCLEALPELKEIYTKYHAKGLEILGISLDTKKMELTRFLKEEEIPWPQSFDDKNEVNAIAERLHIGPIPTMWLVDAQGIVRETLATEDTEARIAALLASAGTAPAAPAPAPAPAK